MKKHEETHLEFCSCRHFLPLPLEPSKKKKKLNFLTDKKTERDIGYGLRFSVFFPLPRVREITILVKRKRKEQEEKVAFCDFQHKILEEKIGTQTKKKKRRNSCLRSHSAVEEEKVPLWEDIYYSLSLFFFWTPLSLSLSLSSH